MTAPDQCCINVRKLFVNQAPSILHFEPIRRAAGDSAAKWTALFEFGTVVNISEFFGPLEKPPLAALSFFLGC